MSGFYLFNFPILFNRELNEILYDYLDTSMKPRFVLCVFKPDVKKGIVGKVEVFCLKCGGIMQNPYFSEQSVERQFIKVSNKFELPYTNEFERATQEMTYFETKDDRGRVMKGNYDFRQLSEKKQYILTNILFESAKSMIRDDCVNCVTGSCNKIVLN